MSSYPVTGKIWINRLIGPCWDGSHCISPLSFSTIQKTHVILYQCISDSWSLASSGLLLSWPPFIPQWWETIWKQPGSPEVTRPLVSPKTPLLLQKLPWPPCSERGFPSLAWAMPLPNRFSNATFCKSYHLLERKELSLQIMYNFYILI